MPAAISGTETVGMPPPSVADVFIQRNFHTIRSLLGYDTSYGIRYINLYHIPLLLQRMLEPFKTGSGSRGKESEGFRTTQLPGDYFTYTETRIADRKRVFRFIQLSTGYEKTKTGRSNCLHPFQYPTDFFFHRFVGHSICISHRLIDFGQWDRQVSKRQFFFKHY